MQAWLILSKSFILASVSCDEDGNAHITIQIIPTLWSIVHDTYILIRHIVAMCTQRHHDNLLPAKAATGLILAAWLCFAQSTRVAFWATYIRSQLNMSTVHTAISA